MLQTGHSIKRHNRNLNEEFHHRGIVKPFAIPEEILPISLAEASELLQIEQNALRSLAEQNFISHIFDAKLQRYYFTQKALLNFCEGISQISSNSANKFSHRETANCAKSESNIKPLPNSDFASSDPSKQFSLLEQTSIPPKKNEDNVELISERLSVDYMHEIALKRLQRLCLLDKVELTKTIDAWSIEHESVYIGQEVMKSFNVNVIPVKRTDLTKGYRLDMRSIKFIKEQIKQENIENRPRLKAKTKQEALEEARIKFEKILNNIRNKYFISEELQKRNHNLIRKALTNAERKARRVKYSQESLEVRKRRLAFWNYVFYFCDICTMDDEFIESVIDEMFKAKKSGSTVNKYLIELREMYSIAFGKRWINESLYIPSFQSGRRELFRMNKTQFNIFVKYAAKNETERNLLELAYYSGLRLGNCLNHININNLELFDESSDEFHKQSFLTLNSYNVKNKKPLKAHLTQPSVDAIKRQISYRESQRINHPNIFSMDNLGSTIKIDNDAWKAGLKAAGVNEKFTFHQFRHNRAYEILVLGGGSFEDVRQILGLASFNMVQYVYGHIDVTHDAVKANNRAAI